MLGDRRILLVIGGGIAAYKTLDLIRRLRERGARVRAVMTQAAAQFVTPLSVASLSGDKLYNELFSLTEEAAMGHIELSRDADLLVVAPATADLIGKMAGGLADDLASTLLLATDKRILAAPAMNLRMWLHPAVARNIAQLRRDGVLLVGPNEGEMACGEYGPGRMAEPLEIVGAIEAAFGGDTSIPPPEGIGRKSAGTAGPLAGTTFVVTSGPTHEPIDPVRYIANRSSGKQGHAIAAAAAAAGARVVLVSGPVSLPDPPGVEVRRVETALEMLAATEAALPADVFIAAAAVADWRPAHVEHEKIKKGSGALGAPKLELAENPDILSTIAHRREGRPRLVIGFAAETERVLENAAAKLARKGSDLILANDVSAAEGVMGGDRNAVHLVTEQGIESWPRLEKGEVARRLVARIGTLLSKAGP